MSNYDYRCYIEKRTDELHFAFCVLSYMGKTYKCKVCFQRDQRTSIYFPRDDYDWEEIKEEEYLSIVKMSSFNLSPYYPKEKEDECFFISLKKILHMTILKKISENIDNLPTDKLGEFVKQFFKVSYGCPYYISDILDIKEKDIEKYLNNEKSIINSKFLPRILKNIKFISK